MRLFRITGIFFLIILLHGCEEPVREDPFVGLGAARWDVGKSANFILSDDRFTALELEIAYMEGFRPTNFMMSEMTNFLGEVALKPAGVRIVEKEIPAGGEEFYTTSAIAELEDQYRESYNEGDTVSVFLLVVDGYFMQNEEEYFTIGAAYRNTSMVLFGKRIAENTGGFRRPGRGNLEATVALHELGHLLGLVNIGTDMVVPHEDPDEDHKYHCDNEDCLMYWAVETSNILNFMQNDVPELDDNCRNDLRANGGR
ncbi:Predicted Zn-dependent protease [Cyclobacterium lianum]|uniref:Predicted Zn-dependent protease n=1 Tax=Cyclobacterium lianum TaxID=388280 RepID=A0A1M7Q9E4_9BACT|nr:hypothetical protein [Cyclobacterium lianum]SHN27179.1 Predicted Zn-dependent protease [Cyclobacterium lianum]